jgi:hypothetical protein
VSNLQLQLIQDNSQWFIVCQWSPPLYNGQQLLGYRVFYDVVAIGDCQVVNSTSGNNDIVGSQKLDSTASSCKLGGLTPWRHYRVTISSIYPTGEANASATVMSQEIGEQSEFTWLTSTTLHD